MAKEKATQLVQLYERKTQKGITFYLHYSLNGEQVRENTHLRLTGNKEADKVTKKAVQMLQAEKTAELLSNRTGIATTTQKNNILLTDYCNVVSKRICTESKSQTNFTKASQIKQVIAFISNVDAKIKVCNVTKQFCEKVLNEIEKAEIGQTTKKHYFARFQFILNHAVKDELIVVNPATAIENKPMQNVAEKVYLTESELKEFAKVETANDMEQLIKDAFLFSALTGLRFSDIKRITADNIEETADGVRLKIETKKTKKYISFVLSPESTEILKSRLTDGIIFDLPTEVYTNKLLKRLSEKTCINKHLTFHSARHTFATLLLTKGADLYTVSTLLGHSNISTTQVYAKIVDKKKDETIALLSNIL